MCRRESETKNILYVGGGGNFLVIQVAPRDMNSELDHHIFAVRARVRRETTDFGERPQSDRRETTDFGERPQSDWSCPQGSQSQKEDQEFNIIIVNICNKLNI